MTVRFAEIAVNVGGVHGVFDYVIPSDLLEEVKPGCLVEIPYNQIRAQGIVVRIKDNSVFDGKIKEITRMIEREVVIPIAYIKMAETLAKKYFQPVSAYLKAMLPIGLSRRPYVLYEPFVPNDADLAKLSKLQLRLLDNLNSRGSQRSTQLDRAYSRLNWRKAMQPLIRKGWVSSKSILPPPKITKKKVNTVLLHPEVDRNFIDEIETGKPGGKPAERRRNVLKVLGRENLPVLVSYVYAATGANSSDVRFLADKGLIITSEQEVIRDPVSGIAPEGTRKPMLTEDQLAAWQTIRHVIFNKKHHPILLRGITGSGKTELYMLAAEEVVKQNRQAVILVPEISLTPQTIQRFLDRFPGGVGVIHSRLSDGERYDTWRRASRGEIAVLIGPRSALLTPLPSIGLIILDECHDDSYYQMERIAFYHSEDAALALAEETDACVILGSATPNTTQYFHAQQCKWSIIHLEKRIASGTGGEKGLAQYLPLPDVKVVDMRKELREGNPSIFSREMQRSLKKVVDAKQQAILFLNRRGSATIIFCRDCGYTAHCPRCDFPLTYHTGTNKLLCHTCGYSRKMLKKCPDCESTHIRQYGMGTERVQQAMRELIPEARILRWDADSVSGKQAEAVILSHFKRHNADVLIGTQMLAKGLDLPLVTLVGVVLADTGLNFPDYRASERAFQLLTQVAGRAGRSHLGGRVILQTFQPEHYAIQHAADHDFIGFYQSEIDRRRDIQYPPFAHLIRLETRDLYAGNAQKRADKLAGEIIKKIKENPDRTLQMIGPSPPYFARQHGYYRWQIILKGNSPGKIIDDVRLDGWRIAIDPPHLL